ncbi:MAG: UDP-2,3-diacylglucosamine diphosphatase LpxI [Rhodospirillales bacterium]|nr:UDP-2,3-diacylglucosamine diphosphatase LpxI [Rhodospirillales bacterium]
MPPKLGVLAGGGQLPARVIEAARATGRDVFVLAFEGHTDPATVAKAPHHAWTRLGAVGATLKLLHDHGVGEVVLAGPVKRPSLGEMKPDWRGVRFLARIGARWFGDDSLLSAVVRELESEGFRVVGADDICAELLTPDGPCGRIAPDTRAEADIARGIAAAREIGRRDVGQAVIVCDGTIAVEEGPEGTDAMLARYAAEGRRGGAGGILVKVAKPGQERRVDLPSVGIDTVHRAAAAGLAGIALEAGNSLIIDRAAVVRAADETGLFVVGIRVAR